MRCIKKILLEKLISSNILWYFYKVHKSIYIFYHLSLQLYISNIFLYYLRKTCLLILLISLWQILLYNGTPIMLISNSLKTSMVLFILFSSHLIKWVPPNTAYILLFNLLLILFNILAIPTWLHPTKTTNPL